MELIDNNSNKNKSMIQYKTLFFNPLSYSHRFVYLTLKNVLIDLSNIKVFCSRIIIIWMILDINLITEMKYKFT
jgi:hypothetical protein